MSLEQTYSLNMSEYLDQSDPTVATFISFWGHLNSSSCVSLTRYEVACCDGNVNFHQCRVSPVKPNGWSGFNGTPVRPGWEDVKLTESMILTRLGLHWQHRRTAGCKGRRFPPRPREMSTPSWNEQSTVRAENETRGEGGLCQQLSLSTAREKDSTKSGILDRSLKSHLWKGLIWSDYLRQVPADYLAWYKLDLPCSHNNGWGAPAWSNAPIIGVNVHSDSFSLIYYRDHSCVVLMWQG